MKGEAKGERSGTLLDIKSIDFKQYLLNNNLSIFVLIIF